MRWFFPIVIIFMVVLLLNCESIDSQKKKRKISKSSVNIIKKDIKIVEKNKDSNYPQEPEKPQKTKKTFKKNTLKSYALVVNFEKNINSIKTSKNPFGAMANASLDNGVIQFDGHDDFEKNGLRRRGHEKSQLVYSGVNLGEKGTIGVDVKFNRMRKWNDKRNTWFICLIPKVGEWGFRLKKEQGTALAVFKNSEGDLVLGIYQMYDGNYGINLRQKAMKTANPDSIVIKIPVKQLSSSKFQRIRMGWNQKTGKVWLGVGNIIKSAVIRIRKSEYNSLLLGTEPEMAYVEIQWGFDGQMDNLIVDKRTPDELKNSAMKMPAHLPPAAVNKAILSKAKVFRKDSWFQKLEIATRSHLDLSMKSQGAHGGWQFSVAYPSMMSFLSSRAVVPYTSRYFNGSKAGNSPAIALKFLAGYDALGEKKYLDVAEKTAKTLLKMQNPKTGNFYYWYIFDEKTGTHEIAHPNAAPFEDHAQVHPVILFYRLYNITGKKVYKIAAEKTIDFIYKGQNPNGSWSHHYDLKNGYGWTGYRGGQKYNGEINDFTTTDQMTIMLIAYRQTGKIKFLSSFLKAADWLVKAFLDDKAKGWCPQYNQFSKPVGARHFEPPAVVLSEGMTSPPKMLINAYIMTKNKKYLKVLSRWRKWMLSKAEKMPNGKPGWYINYKIKTGKPFLHALMKDSPVHKRDLHGFGMQSILKNIELLIAGKYKIPQMNKKDMKNILEIQQTGVAQPNKKPEGWNRADSLLKMFDWNAGTWVFGTGKTRRIFSPATVRILPLCQTLFMKRVLNGDIKADHPLVSLSTDDWWNVIFHLIPRHQVFKPIKKTILWKARKKM